MLLVLKAYASGKSGGRASSATVTSQANQAQSGAPTRGNPPASNVRTRGRSSDGSFVHYDRWGARSNNPFRRW